MAARPSSPHPGLPDYVHELLHRVYKTTNYELRWRSQADLQHDSEVRMVHPGRGCHVLVYRPEYQEHLSHFIVNACRKIFRCWQEPLEERLVPASPLDLTLPVDDYLDFALKNPRLSAQHLEEASRFIAQGLVRQLTSFPPDLRVEHEILWLPEHRPLQSAYLQRQVHDLIPHFAPEIEQFIPARVYRAASAMNIVLAEEAAELARINLPSVYAESKHRDLALILQAHLKAVHDPGLSGDRQVVDAWASEVGIRDWYEWVLLEDVTRE